MTKMLYKHNCRIVSVTIAQDESDPPWVTAVLTYANFLLLIVVGTLRDILDARFQFSPKQHKKHDYADLLSDWQDFYTRRLYNRIQDCFNRPIDSAPGAWVSVIEREFDSSCPGGMRMKHSSVQTLNLSSYNYLGFAESELAMREDICVCLNSLGASTCSSRSELGTTAEHRQLEERVAEFLGKEDAMVCGMGFGSNSLVIPALMGENDLILSDALNHSSIVTGARLSSARVEVFAHNCPVSLEKKLRVAIARGQPGTRRPWKKIVVAVEGLYSMEGEICRLAEISAVCKRYKAYLYVDEAHSIGALGSTVCFVCFLYRS